MTRPPAPWLTPRARALATALALLPLAAAHHACSGDGAATPADTAPADTDDPTDATTPADTDDLVDTSPAVEPDAAAPDAGDAGDVADPSEEVSAPTSPLLADVLSCGTPGGAGRVSPGESLFRYDIDLDAFPNALCNDGTGAVMYVRRHQDASKAGHWLIRIDGGGACRSGDACAQRWCSVDSNFGMDKMSTSLAPPHGMSGPGVHALGVDHPWRDYNHAFVYYCSSDSWTGQASDVELSATGPSGDIAYRVHFRGADIFDAAIATLRREHGAAVTYRDAADSERELPDLDDASLVWLVGASAGGTGTTHNLDRLAERLTGKTVYGLIDSIYPPHRTMMGWEQTPMCLEHGLCDYDTFYRAEQAVVGDAMWRMRTDASCVAWHEAAEAGSSYRCLDGGFVIANHITTPFFLRMDLLDSLLLGNSLEVNFTVPTAGDEPLDADLFAQLLMSQIPALGDLPASAHEGAAITKAPGWFAPSCGHHETLGTNPRTHGTAVVVDGTPWTMFEVIENWLADTAPTGVVSQQRGEGCP